MNYWQIRKRHKCPNVLFFSCHFAFMLETANQRYAELIWGWSFAWRRFGSMDSGQRNFKPPGWKRNTLPSSSSSLSLLSQTPQPHRNMDGRVVSTLTSLFSTFWEHLQDLLVVHHWRKTRLPANPQIAPFFSQERSSGQSVKFPWSGRQVNAESGVTSKLPRWVFPDVGYCNQGPSTVMDSALDTLKRSRWFNWDVECGLHPINWPWYLSGHVGSLCEQHGWVLTRFLRR